MFMPDFPVVHTDTAGKAVGEATTRPGPDGPGGFLIARGCRALLGNAHD